jgi:hypothetical protein
MLPDNRIRFTPPKIDFDNDVGNLGQDIDNFPAPGSQARYDWMRMVLLGLLGNQSSTQEPTQKREGTIWFDYNLLAFKVWSNNEWKLLSSAIPLSVDQDNNVVNLQEWFIDVSNIVTNISQEVTFSGTCSANNITTINLPESTRQFLFPDSRPILFINGILVDPRNSRLDTPELPTSIRLTNVSLKTGDRFTVFIRRIPSTSFTIPSVVVP